MMKDMKSVPQISVEESGVVRFIEATPLQENQERLSIMEKATNEVIGRLEDASNSSDSQGLFTMAISYNDKVFFAGVADSESFNNTYDYIRKSLEFMFEAVNNRTRERNYFKKYAELLMGEISDEEFSKEIEKHESLYVVQPYIEATKSDIKLALSLVENGGLMDVDSLDDIADLFSFKYLSVKKMMSALQG